MANPNEARKISAAQIGEALRGAREKKALTIEQAHKQTRIHSTVLAALEEGRCDDILAPNYVKSFLREYSGFLGLNAKDIVNSYSDLHPEPERQNLNLNRIGPKSAARPPHILSLAKKFLIIALIFLAAVFLIKKAVNVLRPGKSGKTPAVSGPAKPFSQKKGKGQVDIAIKEIPRSTPLALTIRVKRPVMVQLKRDGILLFKRFMQKGAVESLTANDQISISVAKAEAIELTLNGKNLGSPGKGAIKNLEITRTGLRIR